MFIKKWGDKTVDITLEKWNYNDVIFIISSGKLRLTHDVAGAFIIGQKIDVGKTTV